jgi:hypothetical protein
LHGLQLHVAGKARNHRTRVVRGQVGGIGVGSIDQCLHRAFTGVVQALRETCRDDDGKLACAVINVARNLGVVVGKLMHGEVARRCKPFQQALRLLAAFAVVRTDRNVFDVQTDTVAKHEHLHQRDQQRDHQAARVAHDL